MFQIVRCTLDHDGEVMFRRPLQPLFELWEDAMAIAEFDSSRLLGDYGYDEDRNCWWGRDHVGRTHRFAVENVDAVAIAGERNRPAHFVQPGPAQEFPPRHKAG
jgi:hypothetical protein